MTLKNEYSDQLILPRGGQLKILVVDDEDSLRTMLKALLEGNQFLVTTAANAVDALHFIDTELFDVLLTDLRMPGAGDGFTLVRAMRNRHPNAVTLVYTGYPPLPDAIEASHLQPDEILVKPMGMRTLVALIREKLKNRGIRAAVPHPVA